MNFHSVVCSSGVVVVTERKRSVRSCADFL